MDTLTVSPEIIQPKLISLNVLILVLKKLHNGDHIDHIK